MPGGHADSRIMHSDANKWTLLEQWIVQLTATRRGRFKVFAAPSGVWFCSCKRRSSCCLVGELENASAQYGPSGLEHACTGENSHEGWNDQHLRSVSVQRAPEGVLDFSSAAG